MRVLENLLQLSREPPPPAVAERAQWLFGDFLAAVLLGLRKGEHATFHRLQADAFGASGETVDPGMLAYRLAGFAQIFDTTDGLSRAAEWGCTAHPGRALHSVVLALGREENRTLGQCLGAIVAGYESCSAIRRASDAPKWNMEVVPAVVAGACILGLTARQLDAALGQALFLAPRAEAPAPQRGGEADPFKPAAIARAAVEALLSARAGVADFPLSERSPANGVCFVDTPAEPPVILEAYIKPYPTCRMTHAPVEAALILREQAGLKAENIRAVRCRVYPAAHYVLGTGTPHTPKGRMFDLRFLLALALSEGGIAPDGLLHPLPPPAARLLEGIELSVDPALDRDRQQGERPVVIAIETTDGSIHTHSLRRPLGERDRPLLPGDLRRKWTTFAAMDPADPPSPLARILAGEGAALPLRDI